MHTWRLEAKNKKRCKDTEITRAGGTIGLLKRRDAKTLMKAKGRERFGAPNVFLTILSDIIN